MYWSLPPPYGRVTRNLQRSLRNFACMVNFFSHIVAWTGLSEGFTPCAPPVATNKITLINATANNLRSEYR
jgi:hypothetical protein